MTVSTGSRTKPTDAVVTPCGTYETAVEVVARLPAASVASTKMTFDPKLNVTLAE